MRNKMIRIGMAVALVFLFTGCVPTSSFVQNRQRAMDDLEVSWKQENERIALAQGERIIPNDVEQVYTAFITAFSELGLAIKNTERQSGCIYAEGHSILPADEERSLCEQMKAEIMNATGLRSHCAGEMPGETSSTSLTALIQKFDKQTKVKLRINSAGSSPH